MSGPQDCELKFLHYAVESKNLDSLESLLKDGSNPNTADKKGRTALNFICYQAELSEIDLKMIQLLIQHGADANTQDKNGNSPMMNLFDKESNDMGLRIEALKILLRNGADVTRVNNEGQTIFRNIILCNPSNPDTEVALELVLKNGADPNMMINKYGATALNFICDDPKLTRVHLKMIQILLQYKADVNTQDIDGFSPIMSLFRFPENYKFRLEVFKLLLENQADVTLVDHEGNTVLTNIFFYNAEENPIILEAVELLLKSKVGVNVKNKNGCTALHLAAKCCKDIKVIDLLLKNGADPNIVNTYGKTALHSICCRTELTEVHLEMIQLLIQYVADANTQDKNGNSPIMNLFDKESNDMGLRIEALKILLRNGADVTRVNNEGQTIFRDIILCNPSNPDTEVALELVLKNGADPNMMVNKYGATALNFICDDPKLTRVHLKMIQILLQYKADVNTQDIDGFSPIMSLFRFPENYKFRLEVFKLLLENQADVTLVDHEGNTVLHIIFEYNSEENPIILEAVELLLKSEVGVNVKNKNGCTALHLAVKCCKDIKVIDLLLKNGADPNIVNTYGKTALHSICCRTELTEVHLEMIQLLIQYGADVNIHYKDGFNTPIMNLFRYAEDYKLRLKVCKLLLENGADVTFVNCNCNTVLHLIFIIYNEKKNPILLEAVELLLKSGVDVNKQNENGWSALHIAVNHCENLKIIDLLLKNGADPNIVDNWGSTPLHFLCRLTVWTEVHLKLIQLLIQYKADPNVKNHQNISPIMYLFEHMVSDYNELILLMKIFELLVKNGADLKNVYVFSKSMLLHQILRCDNRGDLSKQLVKGLEFLLKNGANVNMKDNEGKTALHHAVYRKRTKHVAFLLKNGADPNITDGNGNTPLNNLFEHLDKYYYYIGLETYFELLKLNVEHNADPCHVGGDGKTVLHSLIEKIRLYILKPKHADCKAVSKYVPQYVEILLKHGLDVNVKDRDGFTALNLAVSYCNYDVAKILVEHGADVNTVQFKGGFFENKVPQSLNLLTTLNVLAIIELWQSKGFQINSYQYLRIFKFLTLHQDFETNDDFYSWLFKLYTPSGRLYDLSFWIKDIYESGSGSLIRKSIDMLLRYDSSICTKLDSSKKIKKRLYKKVDSAKKIKKILYLEVEPYLYLIEYGNMYIDIETYDFLRNKLNLLLSENPEIDEHDRKCRDKRYIDIRDQVDLAKKMIISNNISYLDLCTSSPDKTYYLLQKCDYESAINSADFRSKFDEIGGVIRGYIAKALVRRFIKQSTTDPIKLLFHGILSDSCCDKIIKFLDVIDLVSVFEAVINCES